MANWCGTARSNWFRVRDAEAFREAMVRIDLEIRVRKTDVGETLVMVTPALEVSDSGGWPGFVYPEETDEAIEVDLVGEISPHLVDGEVAVLLEVGAEKLRHLSGVALAFNHAGESRSIGLHDIYRQAAELAPEGASISRAEY